MQTERGGWREKARDILRGRIDGININRHDNDGVGSERKVNRRCSSSSDINTRE